jgi:hypothetical protein
MPRRLLVAVLASALLSACGGTRWSVHQVEDAYQDPSRPERNYSSSDVLLLDERTGESWILWSDPDSGDRHWKRVPRR